MLRTDHNDYTEKQDVELGGETMKVDKKMKMNSSKGHKHRRSFTVLISLLFILSMALMGCSSVGDSQPEQNNDTTKEQEATSSEQILIYTTVYPVQFFAEEIVGEKGEVRSIIPVGAEPHDFEPTARDIINLSQADLFVYNGGGFESWIEKIVDSVNNNELVWVDSTANISLLSNAETGHIHHDEEHADHDDAHHNHEDEEHVDDHAHHNHEDEEHVDDHTHHDHGDEEHVDHDHGTHTDSSHDHAHDHDHGEFDPHVWLDPMLAIKQAEEIKEALVAYDPENAAYYEENFKGLAERLTALDQAFKDLSENVERKDFVVSHAAYGYLANRYNFNQISIAGLNPSNEPSPRQLQEIVEYATEHQVQYILFENMVSAKIAQVVQESVGAEALVLYNLEVISEEELSQGEDFFTLMERNIEVLKKALGYQK